MTKTNKIYLYLAVAVLTLTALFYYLFGNNHKINWQETYQETSKEPYGTYLIVKLLETAFPENKVQVMNDSIADYLDNADNASNYLFVGGYNHMDSVSRRALLEFVERGNNAFFASKHPPMALMEVAFDDYCSEFYWKSYLNVYDSITHFDFTHPNLQLAENALEVTYEREYKKQEYDWAHHHDDLFCIDNEHIVSLGLLNDSLVNFLQVDYGEGSFFFHTNPILFTNSIVKEEVGQDYAYRTFAHLKEGDVYWDKSSRMWNFEGGADWWNQRKTFKSEGPLTYILAQPSLAWAWYIALGLGFLYLLFRAKRQQRIIPVLEPNRNTSLEFISTIGRMYFIQNNHRKLALNKMKLFLAYVREQYKIPTKNLDEKFVQQLTSKSEVNKDLLNKIFQMHRNIKTSGFLSEEMLIKFHQILDQFYKTCK